MKRTFIPLVLSGFLLTGCWVEQIVQGVQPELFPESASEKALENQINNISNPTQAMSYLGGRLIHLGRETAAFSKELPALAKQRQALENHLFFTLKSSLPGWLFVNNEYTKVLPERSSSATLRFNNKSGSPYSYDLLAPSSYGKSPAPALTFPTDFDKFNISFTQTVPNSLTLTQTLQGRWPDAIPLAGSFATTTTGQGRFKDPQGGDDLDFNYSFNGKVQSDGSLYDTQLSAEITLKGTIYSAFLKIDGTGIANTVLIQNKGNTIATIEKNDSTWEVKMDGQVITSVR